MFKLNNLRPATPENTEALDMALQHLSEALHWARQSDEKPAVKAIYAAVRSAKGCRQHLSRRLCAYSQKRRR